MGVGVEAPGRDHHPMTLPQNQQSHNMTNGYNGDHHATGEDQHNGEKSSLVKKSDSVSAASTHSPAEPEEKCIENKMINHNNDNITENGLQKSHIKNKSEDYGIMSKDSHVSNSSISKVEDCNSSKESIDVESTHPEDIKPFLKANNTSSADSKISNGQQMPDASSCVQTSTIKPEDGGQPEVDWSLYHLGDMTLEVWLQTIRKHVVMSLFRHPKSEAFRRPVDPVALGIFPFYNQIITRPMDLGTVKNNIENGVYTDKNTCLQDVNQVWLNAKKFNPCTHVVHQSADFLQKQMFDMLQNLIKSGGATSRKSLPPVAIIPPPMRHVGIREAKKRPVGLPGEYDDIKPQHLEQKYALRLSEPLRQCDTIMRNLMLQSQHWDYVEPFMKPPQKTKGKPNKMSLALINDRLRSYYYSNALEFATDIRRIITETYRDSTEPIEEDFRAQKARLLQKEFEFQFARVKDDDESDTGGLNKASVMKDPYMSKLIKAQELLNRIDNGVSSLTTDVVAFMDKKREKKKHKIIPRSKMASINNHSAIDNKTIHSPPKKRQRTNQSENKTPKKNVTSVQPVKHTPQPPTLPTANPEQIGEWIQNLDAEGQEHLLEILKGNNEEIEVDDEGEVELSLENWSSKTLADVEMYLRLKLNEPIGPPHGTTSTVSTQNQSVAQRQYEQPPNTISGYQPNSNIPDINVQRQIPTSAAALGNKTGGKHISKDDSRSKNMAKDGSDSSSDSSESSDDSSSSDGNSSDENQ